MELHLVAADVLPAQGQHFRDPRSGEDGGADRGGGLRMLGRLAFGRVERLHQGADLASGQQPLAAIDLRLAHVLERIAELFRAQPPLQRLAKHVMEQPVEVAGLGLATDDLTGGVEPQRRAHDGTCVFVSRRR